MEHQIKHRFSEMPLNKLLLAAKSFTSVSNLFFPWKTVVSNKLKSTSMISSAHSISVSPTRKSDVAIAMNSNYQEAEGDGDNDGGDNGDGSELMLAEVASKRLGDNSERKHSQSTKD